MEKTIQRFHCTIVKMEILILYHVVVNSQLSRDNLTKSYINISNRMYAVMLSFYSFPRLNAIRLNLSRTVLVKQKLKGECRVYTHVFTCFIFVQLPIEARMPILRLQFALSS